MYQQLQEVGMSPHSLFLSPLGPRCMCLSAGLSAVMIMNSKGKDVSTVFNADYVVDEEEGSGPAVVWQQKIAGMPALATPQQEKQAKWCN